MSSVSERVARGEVDRPWWEQRWPTIGIGFALAFVTGMAYASWLISLGDWNQGFGWERSFMHGTQQPMPRVLDWFLYVSPWTGTNISLIPVVAVAGVVLWRRGRSDLAMHLFVVQVGSFLLNPALKVMFDRTRPELFVRRGWYGWSAFPSGHAICTIAVLFTIAVILHRERGWRWIYAVIIPVAAASLYSRVYLGVHWPTDVIGGILVGFVWLVVTMVAFRPRQPAPEGATASQRVSTIA
jgi:undecaprenyl-diphosphatase